MIIYTYIHTHRSRLSSRVVSESATSSSKTIPAIPSVPIHKIYIHKYIRINKFEYMHRRTYSYIYIHICTEPVDDKSATPCMPQEWL